MDVRRLVLLIVIGSIASMSAIFIFLWTIPNVENPTLDNRLAIELIKNYYLSGGIDLEKLSSNYTNSFGNETGLFSYVYRQRYDGEKFIIRIYYRPANIYFSECFIRENEILGCRNTEEGDDFIQKYS